MGEEYSIRTINPIDSEIELIASRMRQTLIEVLGEEKGKEMYSMPEVIERVRWHLDPEKVCAHVFVAEDDAGKNVGHTIVRVDDDGEGNPIGLFATTYIIPEVRRKGLAVRLIEEGERWMKGQDMAYAATYTDEDNEKLQQLYLQQGYVISPMPKGFVKLSKSLF